MNPLAEFGLDIGGHAILMLAFGLGAWAVFRRWGAERVAKWDKAAKMAYENNATITTHLKTCELRGQRIEEALGGICGQISEVKTSLHENNEKMGNISDTVSELVGREKERDRQARR